MKEERKPCLHTLMLKWFYGQSERAYYLNYFINTYIVYYYKRIFSPPSCFLSSHSPFCGHMNRTGHENSLLCRSHRLERYSQKLWFKSKSMKNLIFTALVWRKTKIFYFPLWGWRAVRRVLG